MKSNGLPFNWFDVLVVIVLAVGFVRGRKRGMSQELIGLLTWLTIVFVCAFVYLPLGTMIVNSGAVFSTLFCYLLAYLGSALIIAILFALLKKGMGEKMVSSETFGKSEFYLGMASGVVRFTCILIFALALLNSRGYTAKEVQDDIKEQNYIYGSNFFPKLYSIQAQVFEQSLLGPWIRQNLGQLLIKSTVPEQKQFQRKEVALP